MNPQPASCAPQSRAACRRPLPTSRERRERTAMLLGALKLWRVPIGADFDRKIAVRTQHRIGEGRQAIRAHTCRELQEPCKRLLLFGRCDLAVIRLEMLAGLVRRDVDRRTLSGEVLLRCDEEISAALRIWPIRDAVRAYATGIGNIFREVTRTCGIRCRSDRGGRRRAEARTPGEELLPHALANAAIEITPRRGRRPRERTRESHLLRDDKTPGPSP